MINFKTLMLVMLLVGGVFAQTMTQIVVSPSEDGNKLDVAVLASSSAVTGGTELSQNMQTIIQSCKALNQDPLLVEKCVFQKGLVTAPDLSITSVSNPRILFSYWNSEAGKYIEVSTCSNLAAETKTISTTDSNAQTKQVSVSSVTCDLKTALGDIAKSQSEVRLKIDFVPDPTSDLKEASFTYPYNSNQVDSKSSLSGVISKAFDAVADSPAFLAIVAILGIMLAAGMASGRNPLSMFDLYSFQKAPAGGSVKVTASGNITVPGRGPAETASKATATMAAMKNVATESTAALVNSFTPSQRAAYSQLSSTLTAPNSRVANWLGSNGEKEMRLAAGALAIKAGKTPSELGFLNQPIGPANAAKFNALLNAINASSAVKGYEGLIATIESHQSLRSFVGTLGSTGSGTTQNFNIAKKFIGSGYGYVGGTANNAFSAVVRSGRMFKRMTIAIAENAPTLVSESKKAITGRSTMVLAGRKTSEDAAKAKASSTGTPIVAANDNADPTSKQVLDVRAQISHQYNVTLATTQKDAMGYVILQMYKSRGAKFNVTHDELDTEMAKAGYDIVARSKGSSMSDLDAKIKSVLMGSGTNSDKFTNLVSMAKSMGAHVDSSSIDLMEKLESNHLSSKTDASKFAQMHLLLNSHEILTSQKLGKFKGEDGDFYVCSTGNHSLDKYGPAQEWRARLGTLLVHNLMDSHNASEPGGLEIALKLARLEHVGKHNGLGLNTEMAEHNKNEFISCLSAAGKAAFKSVYGHEAHNATLEQVVDFYKTGGAKAASMSKLGTNAAEYNAFIGEMDRSFIKGGFNFKRVELHITEEGTTHQYVKNYLTKSVVGHKNPLIEAELAREGIHKDKVSEAEYLAAFERKARNFERGEALLRALDPYGHAAYGNKGALAAQQMMSAYVGLLDAAIVMKHGENHADHQLIQKMSGSLPEIVSKLSGMAEFHKDAISERIAKKVTLDEVNSSIFGMHDHPAGIMFVTRGGKDNLGTLYAGNPLGKVGLRDEHGQLREVGDEHADFGENTDLARKFAYLRSMATPDPAHWSEMIKEVDTWAKSVPSGTKDSYARKVTQVAVLQARDQVLGHHTEGWGEVGLEYANRAQVMSKPHPIFGMLNITPPEILLKLGNKVEQLSNAFNSYAVKVAGKTGGSDFMGTAHYPMHWANYQGNAATLMGLAATKPESFGGISSKTLAALLGNHGSLEGYASTMIDRGTVKMGHTARRDMGALAGPSRPHFEASQVDDPIERLISRLADVTTTRSISRFRLFQEAGSGTTGQHDVRYDSLNYVVQTDIRLREQFRALFGNVETAVHQDRAGEKLEKGMAIWYEPALLGHISDKRLPSEMLNPYMAVLDSHGKTSLSQIGASVLNQYGLTRNAETQKALLSESYTPNSALFAVSITQERYRRQMSLFESPQMKFFGPLGGIFQYAIHKAAEWRHPAASNSSILDRLGESVAQIGKGLKNASENDINKKYCPRCHTLAAVGKCPNCSSMILGSVSQLPKEMRYTASGPTAPVDELAQRRNKKQPQRADWKKSDKKAA